MLINIVLLVVMIISALWTVISRSLLRSAMGLAVVSIVVTMLMFRMDSDRKSVV